MPKFKTIKLDKDDQVAVPKSLKQNIHGYVRKSKSNTAGGGGGKSIAISGNTCTVIKHHKIVAKKNTRAKSHGKGAVKADANSTVTDGQTKRKTHSRKCKNARSRLVSILMLVLMWIFTNLLIIYMRCKNLVHHALVCCNLATQSRKRTNNYHRYIIKRRQERRHNKWYHDY